MLKSLLQKLLLTLAFFMPGLACAQAVDEFFKDCPAFSAQESSTLRWEPIRAPDMLFCRAIRNDGSEAFALTFSRESPFDPRRAKRAEVSDFNGQKLQWYKGAIASDREALIREALIDFGDGHVLHISMRADDAQTLTSQQRDVLALPFPRSQQLAKGN